MTTTTMAVDVPASITSPFDYKDILRRLQQKGRSLFGPHFKLHKPDLPIIVPIVAWMLRDDVVASQCRIDLNKGIFLGGDIGTGKTQLMQLMRCIVYSPYEYAVHSCPKIALDFGKSGTQTIMRYSYDCLSKNSSIQAVCCFDDLGKEINTKHYGTSCNIMQQILLARYELFVQHGIITHVTSALNTLQLEEKYGTGIRSRFREMFNRITFPANTADKRKNYLQ
ncbi:hypothetical protein [Chitinophaga rhizophila]|uniref:DNA replication protein DnaC n=1 Tax=Chitinophaga rhizophila TaxID=2866212 RepID=A0ABS7GKC9_9BACT|nr:hypothetical protein [Chitinophaga rhizophila]MBW8688174.1 hypothetical protein [Chitinophaga rhizophila]